MSTSDPVSGSVNESPRHLVEAFLAGQGDLRLAFHTGDALLRDGHEEEAVAVWALAEEAHPRLRRIKDMPDAPPEMRAASARADAAFRSHFTRLHLDSIDALGAAGLRRVRDAIWAQTHEGPVAFKTERQRPLIFYMPDLPAQAVTPGDRLPWGRLLETAWREIRDEYRRAVEENIAMAPYVPAATPGPKWAALRGTLDWSSIHIYKDAQATAHTQRFPRTLEALADVDLVRVNGVPMEVLFSRLRPGAHIPPHYGLTNTRLTTHLPLIVPADCAIRIGGSMHSWTEGEILAFDDSFEHEAWNRSDTDRIVLILHVHRPDLSSEERAAIEQTFADRQSWLANRRALLARYLASGGS